MVAVSDADKNFHRLLFRVAAAAVAAAAGIALKGLLSVAAKHSLPATPTTPHLVRFVTNSMQKYGTRALTALPA